MADRQPTEAETSTLESIFASTWFGTAVFGGSFLTVQLLVVVYTISSFLRLPTRKRVGRGRFVLTSLIIFATSSIDGILDIWEGYRILYIAAISQQSFSSVYVTEFEAPDSRKWMILGDAMLAVTITVGDILMLWRCFVLWSTRRWVSVLPFLTWIGAIGCHIFYLVRTANNGPNAYSEIWGARAVMLAVSLSVTTNIVITFLILLRLTMTRKHTSKAFPDLETSPWYWRVIVMLIESAFPLAFFGICWITTRAISLFNPPGDPLVNGRLNSMSTVFALLYSSFCALSPQMIIARTMGVKQSMPIPSSDDETLSEPMQFAPTGEARGSLWREST